MVRLGYGISLLDAPSLALAGCLYHGKAAIIATPIHSRARAPGDCRDEQTWEFTTTSTSIVPAIVQPSQQLS